MNKQNKNIIIFLVVLIVGLSIGAALFFDYWKENRAETINENPASVYCQEQGGKLEIREDTSGGQYGVCIFTDGSECEEWAFFRGECGKDKQNDCLKQGGYCAEECNESDGVVYLKGCASGQVCCMAKEPSTGCKDLCGDGICQEVVCMAIGCPCAETKGSCPQDCK